jgi:endonuclease V-like protein UPF0215 family
MKLILHRLEPTPSEKNIDWKTGVRVLGVAESFDREDKRSVVVGVIMRGDRYIDGLSFCRPHVGGMDATDELIAMYERLNRQDIRVWILGGSAISWFNIIDIKSLSEATKIPVICVTYHASDGIEKYLQEYFPNSWKERIEKMSSIGERKEVVLTNGHTIYLNNTGINLRSACRLVELFIDDGKIPEPIKVARIAAASLRRDLGSIISS